jgi:hypothetical protein
MVAGQGPGKKGARKGGKRKCENCSKLGHTKDCCWSPGGGRKGEGPTQAKSKSKGDSANVSKDTDDGDLFAFMCISNYRAVAARLDIGATPVDAILDSGASRHFSPHRSEFRDFEAIDREIKMADGRTFKAVRKGNVHIVLPNGRSTTPVLLKDCVYAPEMAFTLISVSRLAKVTRGVTFNATHAVVTHKQGHVMARIPESQGLYHPSVG